MKNYYTMKNADLKKELEEKGLEVPVHKNGNIDRKASAALLMSKQSDAEKRERFVKERVVCILHGDGTEAGSLAQFVSISDVANGINYDANIPRETEVDLPAFVVDYLNSLYQDEYKTVEDYERNRKVVKKLSNKRFKITEIDRYLVDEEN